MHRTPTGSIGHSPVRGIFRRRGIPALILGVLASGLLGSVLYAKVSESRSLTLPVVVGDTVVAYGPLTVSTSTGSAQLHVERFPLTVAPGQRYLLRVENGLPDGSARVTGGAVVLNGSEVLSESILAAGGAGWTRQIQARTEDTLHVTVEGGAGAQLTVSVLATVDGSFPVFETERFIRQNGAPGTDLREFALPASAGAPFRLCLVNGDPDGTDRIASASIKLNGVEVVGSTDLSQQVAGLMRDVSLLTENTLEIRLTAQPDGFVDLCVMATDIAPPVMAISAPPPGLVTRDTLLTVGGTVEDQTAVAVSVNGVVATLGSNDSWSAEVPLAEGINNLTITATDAAGNQTDSVRTVQRDREAPVVTILHPAADGYTADSIITIAGTVSDASTVTLNVNGTPVTVDSLGTFSTIVETQGETNIFVVNATDAAGNATSAVRIVRRDLQAPTLSVTAPAEGDTTTSPTVTVTGTVVDSSSVVLTVNGDTAAVTGGLFEQIVELIEGPNSIAVIATDAFGNSASVNREIIRVPDGPALPPDPASVASALDPTRTMPLFESMEFLWTGEDPIQTGVSPETISPTRVVVARGRVLDRDAEALSAVAVRINGHPEFGETLSRADGEYDIAMNGGSSVTLEFEKAGYLPVQRTFRSEWQEWIPLDSVIMTPLDTIVTTVDFSDSVEVAQGSAVTDSDGTRQATLMFFAGTSAELLLSNDSLQPISSLNVRATEYTVGSAGAAAMPGELPSATAYTYAVELSVDEAIAANAKSVHFSQPVSFYIENFLELPVGAAVPVGTYDRELGAWKPDVDGRVISIVDTTGGAASVAVTSSGVAASAAVLDSLGFTTNELIELAAMYPIGTELWRTRHSEFSAKDLNFTFLLPRFSGTPNISFDRLGALFDCFSCVAEGSVIGVQNQTLGESLPVAGTPFTLTYSSDRNAGQRVSRRITIPAQIRVDTAEYAAGRVAGRNEVPSHTISVSYVLEVAGKKYRAGPFSGDTIPKVVLEWDGLDAAGRRPMGPQKARISAEFTFENLYAVRMASGGGAGRSFGSPMGAGFVTPTSARRPVPRVQVWEGTLGSYDASAHGLGGWSLSAHHAYDPTSGTLYEGNGTRREAAAIGQSVRTHTNGSIPNSIAVGPDGSVYMAFGTYIQRYSADGTGSPVVVAGVPGQFGYSGEGLPATQSLLSNTSQRDIAFGPDGLLYLTDNDNHRIRRVDADGTLRTVAGSGSSFSSGDGGLALDAGIAKPIRIAFQPDGSLIFEENNKNWIRRIAPNGLVSRFAGIGGLPWHSGDGGPATSAQIYGSEIAVGPDGSVYLAHGAHQAPGAPSNSYVIRKIRPDGIIETIAGIRGSATGTPARTTFLNQITDIAVAPNGDVYFSMSARIYAVTPSGEIRAVAGTRPRCDGSCNPVSPMATGLASSFTFGDIQRFAIFPDLRLIIGDGADGRRRLVSAALPGFNENEILVAAEDGATAYQFDQYGRHLRTLDAMTRDTILEFGYDSTGWLTSIADADGEVTTIERTGGVATAIVGPFGQRTELDYDSNGYLDDVTNAAGERITLTTASTGLLQSMTDPRGGQYAFLYDSLGRLVSDSSAANRVQTLARLETDTSSTVTLSDNMGRATTYRLDRLGLQHERRTVTNAAGLVTTSTTLPNDSSVTVTPDGTTMMSVSVGDSRFGAQSSVLRQARTILPSGLTSTVSASRRATLASANDPLSLTSLYDSVNVNGRAYRSLFTKATRTLVTTSPMGRTTTTVYDTAGRVTSSTVPGIEPATYAYDAHGRLSQAQSGGRTSTFAYDAAGRLLSTTDPVGRRDSLFYDAADRLTRRVLPDGREVAFAYDSAGNLTSVTPPGKPAHTFEYAPADQLAAYNPPTNGLSTSATTYAYNLAGQVTAIRRPTGDSISFGYDLAGRPSSVGFDRGSIGFTYHGTTGLLTNLSAPGGLGLAFTYDGSLPTSVTWSGAVSGSTAVTYDNNFRVTGQTVNGAHAVSFGYDLDGLLTQAGALGLRRDAQNGRLDADSVLAGAAVQRNAYAYDAHGALSALTSLRDADTLFATSYTRDSLSRITTLTERVAGTTQVIGFAYDSVGRLSTVTRNGVATASYTYDLNGNRATKTTAGGVATAVVDDQDRLTSYGGATYAYTNNGELSRKIVGTDTTHYTYDALGNLTRVVLPDGTAIGYLIDAQNRRIGRTVNDTLVRAWLYQGQLTPVAELDGQGNVVSRFVYATGVNVPDYLVRDDSTYRLLRDHLGSVRLVVNVASGTVAQRLSYDEFGTQTENTNPGWQPFGFAGGLTDAATGLVRFGARDYDPVVGRWTAKDPIGFAGGATSLYSYVANDPVNFVDVLGSSGRSALTHFVIGAAGGAIVGMGVAAALTVASPLIAATATVGLVVVGGVSLGFTIGQIITGTNAWTGAALSCEQRIDMAASLLGGIVGGGLGAGLGARMAARAPTAVGGRAPVLKGQGGVEQAIGDLEAAGGRVLGREITLEVHGMRTRPDLFAELPSGQRVFIEVKTGPSARLNPNQRAAHPLVSNHGATPRGANAARAGLAPGTALGPTPVWTVHIP